jgi:hypothetical protein
MSPLININININNENKTRGTIQGGSTQHLIVAQELKQCRGG